MKFLLSQCSVFPFSHTLSSSSISSTQTLAPVSFICPSCSAVTPFPAFPHPIIPFAFLGHVCPTKHSKTERNVPVACQERKVVQPWHQSKMETTVFRLSVPYPACFPVSFQLCFLKSSLSLSCFSPVTGTCSPAMSSEFVWLFELPSCTPVHVNFSK